MARPGSIGLGLILVFIGMACYQCGHARTAPTPNPMIPVVSAAKTLPSAWDGQSDWDGSSLQVIDE